MTQKILISKTIAFALVLALFMPVFALAQINSETSAESDTGGNTSGSGSSGDASASSHSTTVIDGSGNGTVEINIITNTNGTVQNETIKKEIQGGVEVRVSTTSTSKPSSKSAAQSKGTAKAEVDVKVRSGSIFSRIASTTFWRTFPLWAAFSAGGTTTADVEVKDDGRVLTMIERPQGTEGTGVGGFFSSIINIFIFWR